MQYFSYESIDSTNLQARRLWHGQANSPTSAEPLAVTASTQTAGMGRLGRSWLSPKGGLWLTLVWPLSRSLTHYQALPLAVGLVTVETIMQVCGIACQIKWPNDVLVGTRKLAGILCQAEPELEPPAILIGVGINGNFTAAELGSGLRQAPTTLQELLDGAVDLGILRDTLLAGLTAALREYDQYSLEPLVPRIRQRLAWLGQRVVCQDTRGRTLAAGTLRGIDPAGCVLLESDGRTQTLAIGELHLAAALETGTEKVETP